MSPESIELADLADSITIDFEAEIGADGALRPTEVGLTWVGGRTASCFIAPEQSWKISQVDGVNRKFVSAQVIARSIARHAKGKLLISDACFVDQPMLDMVMGTAGLPKIKLLSFFPVLERVVKSTRVSMSDVNQWIVEIDNKRGDAHRAGEDSRVRAALIDRLLQHTHLRR